jgi:transcriptional regulator GlxA family with amidase domain
VLHRLANGTQTIEDAADQAGLCRRQFERKSRIYAGVSPKDLTRIGRFSRALRISRESSLNWTEIAHATDYHDHMHMVRDFRAFAGDSPTWTRRMIAAEHLVNFCPSS